MNALQKQLNHFVEKPQWISKSANKGLQGSETLLRMIFCQCLCSHQADIVHPYTNFGHSYRTPL